MFHLLGLVGHPVQHSLSPPMHKAALAHFGLEGDYRLVDLADDKIEHGVAELRREGYVGFNVTIPHKQTFAKLVAELSPEAGQLGAVNTVKIDKDGRLIGHNTDIGGFMSALSAALPSTSQALSACVVGSGGAARSAVWGLIFLGWPRIQILARNMDSAEQIQAEVKAAGAKPDFNANVPRLSLVSTDLSQLQTPDLVINCTPVGLFNEQVPDWFEQVLKWMDPQGTFFDMVYPRGDKPTCLMKTANQLRLNCVDGTQMLLEQAALSFHYWTGKRGPIDVMKKALKQARNLPVDGHGKEMLSSAKV